MRPLLNYLFTVVVLPGAALYLFVTALEGVLWLIWKADVALVKKRYAKRSEHNG